MNYLIFLKTGCRICKNQVEKGGKNSVLDLIRSQNRVLTSLAKILTYIYDRTQQVYLLNRTESVLVSKSLYVSLQWDAGLC